MCLSILLFHVLLHWIFEWSVSENRLDKEKHISAKTIGFGSSSCLVSTVKVKELEDLTIVLACPTIYNKS